MHYLSKQSSRQIKGGAGLTDAIKMWNLLGRLKNNLDDFTRDEDFNAKLRVKGKPKQAKPR